MECRSGCAACCIAPSISSPLPGLPEGKPAGVPCPNLDGELRCHLFGHPDRPTVCSALQPSPDLCGENKDEAMALIQQWEEHTRP